MVDGVNKQRLEDNLAAYENFLQATPAHKKDHDKYHVETTYHKGFKLIKL